MAKRTDIKKVLIIGSGPIIIGQACEFDYSGTQACKALRKLGYEIVLVNSNPATIMTDTDTADVTYIEPLNVERLSQIIEKERPDALLPNLGGQSGLNLCSELAKEGVLDKYNVQVIGVPDKRYGEEIMACIILKEPGSVTVEEMTAYIKASMARHKVPKYIEFVDSFPMNAAGKILKYKMRQEAAEELGLIGDGADTAGPGK